VNPVGWNAHVYESVHDWAGDMKRVVFFERHPDGAGRQLVGWDGHNQAIYEDVIPHAQLRDGFPVPTEALRSLGELLQPGPSAGEVKRLEEALAIERARVDRWIGQGPGILHQVAPTDRGADVVALILSERAAEFVRSVLVAFDGPETGKKLAAEVVAAIDGRTR
jgi:hypothetical protein